MKKIAVITGASSGMGKRFAETVDRYDTFDEVWVIARQQDKIAVVRVGCLGKLGQKLALLLPPRSSLFGAEGGKRRVQMQIGGMQKFNHGAPPFLPPCSGLSSRRW